MRYPLLLSAALVFAATPALAQDSTDHSAHIVPAVSAELKTALAAPTRTPANVLRDKYRHPAETLTFFGVKPGDVVVEAMPGGGWYTEVLAPLLKSGTLYLAQPDGKGLENLKTKLSADPATYGKVKFSEFPMKGTAVPDGSADVVLTFRNVHNLIMNKDETVPDQAFAGFFRALKPGGVLGVVDHRLPEDRDSALQKSSGYLKRSTIIALAQKAGFKLEAESEINANPKDTADWPGGVWTLPPSYANGDADKAKYQAIGESDRMTLKFVKPKA